MLDVTFTSPVLVESLKNDLFFAYNSGERYKSIFPSTINLSSFIIIEYLLD